MHARKAKLVGKSKPAFAARLSTWAGKAISKEKIGDEATARKIETDLKTAKYSVAKITRNENGRADGASPPGRGNGGNGEASRIASRAAFEVPLQTQ